MIRLILTALALVALASNADARPRYTSPSVPSQGEVGCSDPIMRPCTTTDRVNFKGELDRKIKLLPDKAVYFAKKYSKPIPPGLARVMAEGAGRAVGLGSDLVSRARSYMGQTARQIGLRRSLWCSAFMRHITHASGVDDRAISWIHKPRVPKAVGAIAVMRNHVGVVAGFDARGNPIIISGNHGRRVGEGVYSAHRVLAYVSAS